MNFNDNLRVNRHQQPQEVLDPEDDVAVLVDENKYPYFISVDSPSLQPHRSCNLHSNQSQKMHHLYSLATFSKNGRMDNVSVHFGPLEMYSSILRKFYLMGAFDQILRLVAASDMREFG